MPVSSKAARRSLALACVRAALALPVASLAFWPAQAGAQDKKELSRARAQFQRGIELEQAGNYTTALEQFRDVGQVRMTPQVRFHIASCEEKLGRLVTALGGYQLAYADADSVGEDFKSEVDRAVTRLEASIPKLVIMRGTGAEAAEIQLDGVSIGASSVGVPVPLDPGPHAVTAKAPFALPFSQTVTLKENEQNSIDVSLIPEPTPEPSEPRLPSGPAAPTSDRPNRRLTAYVIGGVGVASLISSAVLFGLRQSTLSDLENKCGPEHNCPSSAANEYSNLKTYNVTAQIALGVGVAGVGTALTMLILQRKQAPSTSTSASRTWSLSAPNSLVGLSWGGRF